MRSLRSAIVFFGLSLIMVAGFHPTSRGQGLSIDAELKPYTMNADLQPITSTRVRQMKDARLRINGPDYKQNVAFLEEYAQHMFFKVTHAKYYNTGSDSGLLMPRPTAESLDSVFRELDDYILRPNAENVGKMTVDNADFIKEFGIALDNAFHAVMKKNPPPIIRTNAARMLAFVARSGAAVHAKTIAALINDPKTPPEVLLYAYKAAEGFLAAYDVYAVGRIDAARHCAKDDDLIPLVKALENHIIPGPPVAQFVAESTSLKPPVRNPAIPPGQPGQPAPPAGRIEVETQTPEQVAVIQYFRRAAVRALAQVRFDIIGGKNGFPELRPAVTLARVAMNDVAVVPPATISEQAEAVMGLCTMNLSPTMNVDELCQAIATGMVDFARVKNEKPDDRSIPWRIYGNRLSTAFTIFRNSTKRNPRALRFASLINGVSGVIQAEILTRLDRPEAAVGVGPNVERVIQWQQQNPSKAANNQLFEDNPASKLTPRQQQ